jgi:hypothetical protein
LEIFFFCKLRACCSLGFVVQTTNNTLCKTLIQEITTERYKTCDLVELRGPILRLNSFI